MEGSGMDETKKSENHLTSAAAFVEGGIQDACDDACSICLESFDSDPSTVTSCKHEFHLQCILEWCQRSSQCPMCWQSISLKDPTSQELLEAVEHERKLRFNPPRNATIFHHPALGEFELQHLPVGTSDAELEERIIQHLAAAAMGRSHHMARREGHRTSPDQGGGETRQPGATPSAPLAFVGEEPAHGMPQLIAARAAHNPASASGSSANQTRNSAGQSSPINQDRAGPSELQSLSETLKSRLSAVSTRYKETLTKSTRGWKERLFSRNTSMSDISSEVKREVNAGIASVSRLMERLETRENNRGTGSSVPNTSPDRVTSDSGTGPDNPRGAEIRPNNPLNDSNPSPSFAAGSGQN
ncbi:RING-type E3 ubiquitin transferase [Ranunculus cassubicifolius]